MGAAALPVALAVGSAIVGGVNTARTAKKQDAAQAEGIRRQAQEQREANARLNQTLTKFEDSDSGDIRDSLMNRFANQLRLKQAQALAGVNTAGETSNAARELISRGSNAVTSRAGDFGDLFARIDAPSDQRALEGIERTRLNSDLSVFGRNSAAEDFLTRLRLANVRRNPLLDILSSGLSGASAGTSLGRGSGFGFSSTPRSVPVLISNTSGATLPGLSNFPPVKATPGSIFGR